jgi:glycosyltransferase involved in cell wall biosynthesis
LHIVAQADSISLEFKYRGLSHHQLKRLKEVKKENQRRKEESYFGKVRSSSHMCRSATSWTSSTVDSGNVLASRLQISYALESAHLLHLRVAAQQEHEAMNRVSVIIPTHNRAEVLPRALRSVFLQTTPVAEVIVVDDGSTDNTSTVVQRDFAEAVLIRQSNRGVSHARNRGIEQAKGEWLALLDSDDEWKPDKIEVQLRTLQDHPAGRICHTDEIWIRNGRRVNPMNKHRKAGGQIFRNCLPRCALSPSSVLFHRSLIDEFGNFDETLPVCEDYDFWLRVCAALPVIYVPEKLVVKYGGHEDQLSRAYRGMDRYRIFALEKLIQSGKLTATQARETLDEILKKIDIYLSGATRRQREAEVQLYKKKRAVYTTQLSSLVQQDPVNSTKVVEF